MACPCGNATSAWFDGAETQMSKYRLNLLCSSAKPVEIYD